METESVLWELRTSFKYYFVEVQPSKRSVAILLSQGDGRLTRSVCLRFMVEKVPPSQVSVPVLLFSPVIIIPPMLHIHSFS